MAPKIEGAIRYLSTISGEVVITSAEKLKAALDGRAGTRIYSDNRKIDEEGNLLLDFNYKEDKYGSKTQGT